MEARSYKSKARFLSDSLWSKTKGHSSTVSMSTLGSAEIKCTNKGVCGIQFLLLLTPLPRPKGNLTKHNTGEESPMDQQDSAESLPLPIYRLPRPFLLTHLALVLDAHQIHTIHSLPRPWRRIWRCAVVWKEVVLKEAYSIIKTNLSRWYEPKQQMTLWVDIVVPEESRKDLNQSLSQTNWCLLEPFPPEGMSTPWVDVVVLKAMQTEKYWHQLLKSHLSLIL